MRLRAAVGFITLHAHAVNAACGESWTGIPFTFADGILAVNEGQGKIPQDTFKDCESLEEVVLPTSVTFVDISAFQGCSSLKKVC
jgi:hypothetical protein